MCHYHTLSLIITIIVVVIIIIIIIIIIDIILSIILTRKVNINLWPHESLFTEWTKLLHVNQNNLHHRHQIIEF